MSDPLLLDLLKLAGRLQEILDQLESKKHPEVAAAVNQFVTDYSSDKSGPCALFGANCKEVWKRRDGFYGSHILRCDELNEINEHSWGGRKKEALEAVCEESLRFVLDSKCPVDQQEHSEQLRRALRRYLSLQGHAVDTTPAAPRPGEDSGEPPQGITGAKMSPRELANKHDIDNEALRKRLDRWRYDHDTGYVEVSNPTPREPKYLYDESAVMPVIDAMKAKSAG